MLLNVLPNCPLSRNCLRTINHDNTNYSIKIELKSDLRAVIFCPTQEERHCIPLRFAFFVTGNAAREAYVLLEGIYLRHHTSAYGSTWEAHLGCRWLGSS